MAEALDSGFPLGGCQRVSLGGTVAGMVRWLRQRLRAARCEPCVSLRLAMVAPGVNVDREAGVREWTGKAQGSGGRMESNRDASGLGLVGSVGLFLMICLVAGTPLAANRTGPGSDWAVRGKAARAAVFRETRTIANDLVRVTVSLETAGEQARFVVDGMTDLQTGLDLDLSASPIWQVMLASAGTPPPGVAVPADAALGDGPAFVRGTQCPPRRGLPP